ncbi:MAG: Lrp/AsnC ligand binding domain-containing protein [Bacteroidia bacterium]|nr:Lrp/AsnC ligand binding domain-containing protein [Bacteroidia bacterium]
MAAHHSLDDLDRQILRVLLKDANVPYTDIARELQVSGGTIHVRMKKMQEAGVVVGSRLVVSPSALGFDITALIGVYLEKGSAYNHVRGELQRVPEVTEVWFTTGVYNLIIKIVCRDTPHLREVLNEKIQIIEGVERTETFIALEEPISRELSI